MKRLIVICVTLLLIAAMAMTVSAAGAGFSMSATADTLHRGDTVTLTVSVSSDEKANAYGLMLSYDTSAFELVEGSCAVPGAMISSFNNGFAFMFQNATAYSGKVGTVTLKVKDTAPAGSYTISGEAAVKNGSSEVMASGCSLSLKVTADHFYSDWEKVDNTTHKRSCTACMKEESASHSWGEPVTKPASCKEAGTKTYTCTGCKATKTEQLPQLTDHTPGAEPTETEAQK